MCKNMKHLKKKQKLAKKIQRAYASECLKGKYRVRNDHQIKKRFQGLAKQILHNISFQQHNSQKQNIQLMIKLLGLLKKSYRLLNILNISYFDPEVFQKIINCIYHLIDDSKQNSQNLRDNLQKIYSLLQLRHILRYFHSQIKNPFFNKLLYPKSNHIQKLYAKYMKLKHDRKNPSFKKTKILLMAQSYIQNKSNSLFQILNDVVYEITVSDYIQNDISLEEYHLQYLNLSILHKFNIFANKLDMTSYRICTLMLNFLNYRISFNMSEKIQQCVYQFFLQKRHFGPFFYKAGLLKYLTINILKIKPDNKILGLLQLLAPHLPKKQFYLHIQYLLSKVYQKRQIRCHFGKYIKTLNVFIKYCPLDIFVQIFQNNKYLFGILNADIVRFNKQYIQLYVRTLKQKSLQFGKQFQYLVIKILKNSMMSTYLRQIKKQKQQETYIQ